MRGRGWVGPVVTAQRPNKQLLQGWCTFTPSVGNTLRDSWNVSSVTDNGAGDVTVAWAVPFGYAATATGYAVAMCARGTAVLLNANLSNASTLGNAYNVNFVRSRTIVVGGGAGDASVYCVIACGT